MLNSAISRAQRVAREDRRSVGRHKVIIPSVMTDATLYGEHVTVTNISKHGLLASGFSKYRVGAEVSLALPDLGQVDAIIRWAGNGLVGCEFLDTFSDDQLFALLDTVALEN